MTSLSRRALTAVVVLFALVGAACGGGDDRTPQQIVMASASATADANSAKMVMNVAIAGDGTVPAGSITGEGAFDFDEQTGRLTMSMPLQEGGAPVEIEMIMLGTTIYQRFPTEMAQFFGGKPWVKIDLTKAASITGVDLGALSSAQSGDPTQALNQLRGVSDDVEEVGREELRGDNVTHYKLTIDLEKAIASAPEDQRDAMRTAIERFGSMMVPAEVWIDDDDRLRKFVQEMDIPDMGSMTSTLEFYDFGTEVEAEVPPADQVTDLLDLLQQDASGAPQN